MNENIKVYTEKWRECLESMPQTRLLKQVRMYKPLGKRSLEDQVTRRMKTEQAYLPKHCEGEQGKQGFCTGYQYCQQCSSLR